MYMSTAATLPSPLAAAARAHAHGGPPTLLPQLLLLAALLLLPAAAAAAAAAGTDKYGCVCRPGSKPWRCPFFPKSATRPVPACPADRHALARLPKRPCGSVTVDGKACRTPLFPKGARINCDFD